MKSFIDQKLFDILRILQILIPALAAFYVAIAKIWGLPYSAEISGTAAALVALLGAVLKIDSYLYFKENKEDEPVD